ncbi:hypothetical protein [Kitasatospora sp. NPDC018619]|uniref:hypothetical protein n=1 Tax=unclassified Kitasatospora TaxID=2633591 RepID=UPI0037B10FB3
MSAGERFFYYEPADYTACAEHMARDLERWFPETAETCQGWDYNYTGPDIDRLIPALTESGELLPGHITRLGFAGACESLH